ncbi:hypothetical protein LCGC14_2399350, partial [marine sediment metagenome]
IPYDNFIKHPLEVKLIEVDTEQWLDRLKTSIKEEIYQPSPITICEVPKGKGLIRPGGHLCINDRIVYTACVGACFTHIYRHLDNARNIDYSYCFSKNPYQEKWLSPAFNGWVKFREKSLEILKEGYPYVIFVDIAAYYENINILILMSDLVQIGCDKIVTKQLSSCLNRWAQVTGSGVPQGYSPSNILAKLYLNSVDQKLRDFGYVHVRYVDDLRIFCHSKVEANRTLMDLIKLFRKRGLNVQSEKLKVFRFDKAKEKIQGIEPIIRNANEHIIREAMKISGEDNPYFTITKAEEIIPIDIDNPSAEIIRDTFTAHFIDSDDFDKTLFRYLLKRLGKRKDDLALGYCKSALINHAQETRYIIDYFGAIGASGEMLIEISAFLYSEEAIYDYQKFLIYEWLLKNDFINDDFIIIARSLAFDNNLPIYLRCICKIYLGKFGTFSDLEQLEDSYSTCTDTFEQSVIICALTRIESSRRNAFLSRVSGDGEMNKRAVDLVKSGKALN